MNITDEGLDNIERVADKRHNAEMLMLCQILRELRELKKASTLDIDRLMEYLSKGIGDEMKIIGGRS